MAEQIVLDERCRIEHLLAIGCSISDIAATIGYNKTTILHEIIKRAVPCDRGYGCSNMLCAKYETCTRIKGYGGNPKRLFRNTPGCFEACPEFVERTCEYLRIASHVCNGCKNFHNCPMHKRIYDAKGAEADRQSKLHESRRGIHPDNEQVAAMNGLISPCTFRGQSIRNVIANNPDVFQGVAERTIYDYVKNGLFNIRRGDLPEACRRRPRHRKPITKTDAKCRVGRTYKEFIEFCRINQIEEYAEIDTVIGQTGGKLLFTIYLPGGLMLAFLRERKTSATCVRVFNYLWKVAGPELFVQLFRVILTDNGGEFSDPKMIENYRSDPEHNPNKLAPRGIRLFYCDSYTSSQKPHIERTHRDLRRILEHGTSFDALTQDAINLALSHLNSYTRSVLGNRTPYDVFVERFGEAGRLFLSNLGITRIEPNDVTLAPRLLGERFKRHAEQIVLEKNGIKRTSKMGK